MNVLSLFNGMSFCAMALETLGVEVDNYYSSEIDKYANKATEALFNAKPLNFMQWGLTFHRDDFTDDTGTTPTGELEWKYEDEYDRYLFAELHNKPVLHNLGDVTNWREWDIDWSSIDLVTGGFPCQAWSMAGKQLGDKDERGMLFWTMLDIMKHVRYHNPKADFLIENVKMKKEFEEYITQHTENALGKVHKVLINAALVSAQNRNRYYWTSFEVGQPEDKGVILADIIDKECIDVNSDGWHKWWDGKKEFQIKKKYSAICNDGSTDKAICMTARQYASWNGNFAIALTPRGNNPGGIRAENGKAPCLTSNSWEHNNHLTDGIKYRKLTVRECARLQSVPEHHIETLLTAGISNTQLYKMLGNGWNHDVIVHIFKGLNHEN